MPTWTPIVTLLAVALYFFLATQVAVARVKFGVRHPAIVGEPTFERIFRIHMNTLEWLPTFLAPMWLCALYLNDVGAAVVGLVWIVGRVVYFLGYRRKVESRLPGFFIQSGACVLLFLGAGYGVIRHALGG
jgi:glutathione S-transferase